jgi:predicted dithiol-disulfide oxidoreductase (DUF899 family)
MDRNAFPNESPEYRKARDELLDEEAVLRDQQERVAALRRKLPLGGEAQDYEFEQSVAGAATPVKLSELFAPGQDSLLIYGFMYGPQMEQACPMCTSFLDSLNGAAPHISQRISLAVSARSPIERLVAHGEQRGWGDLRLISAANNTYARDYQTEAEDGSQLPMANVFVRRDGRIHHFWSSELFFRANPNGHPRHVDLLWPLWNVLDLTPDGRGDWFPALDYGH